ncbi:nucleotide-binding alpha-beta plait domain-containing protein [Tanacetum coccineum]
MSKEIIVLTSDSSDGNKGVSIEGSSIISIPKEGPSIARRSKEPILKELLEWYGYDTVEDYLPVGKKPILKDYESSMYFLDVKMRMDYNHVKMGWNQHSDLKLVEEGHTSIQVFTWNMENWWNKDQGILFVRHGFKILSLKFSVDKESRDKLWDEITCYFNVDLTVRNLEKSARGKMARSKNVYHHKMGRGGYVFVKEKMIKNKEIEADEEPPRGIMWLKGRVNKDGEFTDDEIRSVGDKLKEADDKIKEGTLNLDDGTDAMIIVFGKEKGGYARGCDKDARIKKKSKSQGNVSPTQELPTASKCKLLALKETNIVALGTVYKSTGKQMLHNQALPNDCYKVSIDSSLVDAACIPDVGNNGLKTVKDGVGGFFAWPKNQVVVDERGSLEDKILTPVPDSSPCCAKCGTPVDGPYCHGCALLRKKFKEYLITYCVENGIFQDSQDTFESSDDNTNVVNAPREPIVVNQDPGVKSSQDPPQIDQNCCYECETPRRFFVYCHEALDKILEELEELKRDQRMLKELKKRIAEEQTAKENMSIEKRMRHEAVNWLITKIKESMMNWVIKDFEARRLMKNTREIVRLEFKNLSKILMNGAAKRYYCLKSTSKEITPDLPIEEPDTSLNMGDEHLDIIPATKSDEVIKSSVENLVPIPSEFEGISDDTCDVPNCDDNRVNVESKLVESLINRDTSIVYSSKIDPILEEFAGELAHIAPIPPRIVEADFDQNDDTLSDNDDFEDIEYISLEEVNDVDQEEKEFD